MKLYLTVIGTAMAVISAVNVAIGTADVHVITALVVLCTALQFALDGIIAIIINKMPDRLFGISNPLYNVSEAEKSLYKKLKVRRWKDKVWELGGIGGFSKRSMTSTEDPEYVGKFIVECNRGVATHRLSYPVGFLAMLTLEGTCVFTVALPIALVNLYLNILPTLVLRYNTPKLKTLYKRLLKKNETVSVS